MHDFNYKGTKLYCEDVSVSEIAQQTGTPVYIYSKKTLTDHIRKLQKAFADIDNLICFSVKSCSNTNIIKLLADQGAGMDIVSAGELYRVMHAGVDPRKVVFAGVGKREEEIKAAIEKNILFFTVESLPELERINKVAVSMNSRAPIAIRVNPDVDPKTHKYITTGKAENKFGLDLQAAYDAYKKAHVMQGIDCVGVHMHIGSQIVDPRPYAEALQKMIPFIAGLQSEGMSFSYLDIGGGMGIIYDKETPSTADNFAQLVKPLVKDLGLTIIIEPGRFIAGNAGIMVTQVQYIKTNTAKKFVIIDAGMNDLIRPSLYSAHHTIEPVDKKGAEPVIVDIVGPICESGDFLAKDRELESVSQDDFLAVMSAGAYGFSMSSNYNSRPRVPEVLVDGDSYSIIRQRETYEDLVRGEVLK